jgi:hypothetical protein
VLDQVQADELGDQLAGYVNAAPSGPGTPPPKSRAEVKTGATHFSADTVIRIYARLLASGSRIDISIYGGLELP